MVAGHTKFAPDRFFATVAKASASSDVFTNEELVSLVSDHDWVRGEDQEDGMKDPPVILLVDVAQRRH